MIPAIQERSLHVRRNAKESSVAVSHPHPHHSGASSVAASTAPLSSSNSSQQDTPDPSHQQPHLPPISPAILSSEQQSTADPNAPLPLHPPPSKHAPFAVAALLSAADLSTFRDPPDFSLCSSIIFGVVNYVNPLPLSSTSHHQNIAARCLQQATACQVQPLLQSTDAAATHPPLIPPPSNSTVATVTHQLCDPLSYPPPPSQPPLPAAAQQLPAVQPHLQSSVAAATHPPLIPPPSNVVAISSSTPLPSSAVSPADSVQHPPSSEVQPSDTSSVSAPAAVPSTAQFLSAQAAPFSPSDPVQATQQTSSLNNQHSTSSLRVYYNSTVPNI
ncbi:vegetative cell wall protein gp1-like [Asparagus officinalis]|uniref:vegetative cell wall protein gp1-like n=1 Tax=Asparagus officinalis TaxID=4686 RepID=UPI00098E55F4|nr:vegetative cell wall protein gp1-like [Asparagus officinalis]